jgi:predicted AAA+ superfamily ATPase
MYKRDINILETNSFFLFGARGTGKSTLIKGLFEQKEVLWINLLLPEQENLYAVNPQALTEQINARATLPEWVVVDEVQKVPKLLDVVHYELESRPEAKDRKLKFALTGSSARKLKKSGANLLAGRAFTNNLYPLTYSEMGDDFKLIDALAWGTLPFVVNNDEEIERKSFLSTYVATYLKEEIIQEQLIRNVTPFRKFLPIASQVSGTILNYNRIASDLGVDWSTVKNYFEILEDTLLGFQLPAYSKSVRKQQLKSSKFYLFDLGVKRALDQTLSLKPTTGQMIGPLFEHFLICELHRLNDYHRKDFRFSYLATQGGLEVDLIIERHGEKDLLVEIKSTNSVTDNHLKHLKALVEEDDRFEAICLSREKAARKVGKISILPWKEGFSLLGL